MHIDRYIEVSQSEDVATFERLLIRTADDLGFGFVNAVLVAERPIKGDPKVVVVGNTPPALIEAGRNPALLARDPVTERLKKSSLPFAYDQKFYSDAGAGDLWEEQARFGYKEGICVALHLPEHRHFLIGVDGDNPLPPPDEHLSRLMADLQLFAVHAQSAAVRLLMPSAEEPQPQLSARELEILKWTMEGKSASVVAEILGLSRHTITYHLASVLRKFGVATKHQAVLRAIEMGMVERR